MPPTTAGDDGRRSGALTDAGFRLDIQGIRGFALVLVLACHAGLPFAEGGFVGLDVFYVLSGFLITGLLVEEVRRTGGVSLMRFYGRRARRLLPLAFTVLAVTVAGALVLFGSLRSYEVAGDVVAAAVYVANWHFMADAVDYFAFDDPNVSPVQHYWSLSVEEQFYVLWPLLVIAGAGLAIRAGWSARRVLLAAVVPICLASFAYGVWFSHVDSQQSYFSTLGRVWQLGLGCLLALTLPLGLRLPRAVSAVLAGGGLAALAWATVAYRDEIPYPGWYALVPTLATVAVIVAGTGVRASAPIRLLSAPPLQYLGRISYAWYLWHWPVLVFAAAIRPELSPLEKVLVTLVAWVPTVVSHHLIEEPFRHSRRLARAPRRAVAFGLMCTAAAVGLGIGLASLQTSVPTARGAEVQGAMAAERGEPMQTSARAISPNPRDAKRDRPRPFFDGCHLKNTTRSRSPGCLYGHRSASTSIVNIGDSHALQYFPALHRLARENRWRLINLTRAGCSVADVTYRRGCDQWREHSLRRIERERPDLVVLHHGTSYYSVESAGRRLSRRASRPYLESGLVRTLRRLKRTGAKVVVLRDIAAAPRDVVDCVADHHEELARCGFRERRSESAAFDARAARRVRRVRLIDPLDVLCEGGRCPAVIGNVLVYRNSYHLTATFARTLAPWLERRLPRRFRG